MRDIHPAPVFDGVRRKYLVEAHAHTGRNVILVDANTAAWAHVTSR